MWGLTGLPLWLSGKESACKVGAETGLAFSSPGDLPDPGIEQGFPALWADSLPSEPPGKAEQCTRPHTV